jgi:hypothetical protein
VLEPGYVILFLPKDRLQLKEKPGSTSYVLK